MGFSLGIIGCVVIALASSLKKENKIVRPIKMKDCPFCGESILYKAKKCKHCGEFIERKEFIEKTSY